MVRQQTVRTPPLTLWLWRPLAIAAPGYGGPQSQSMHYINYSLTDVHCEVNIAIIPTGPVHSRKWKTRKAQL